MPSAKDKTIQSLRNTIKRARNEGGAMVGRAIEFGAGSATGAALGFVRGKYARSDGHLTFGKSNIDVEPVAGLAIGGLGVTGLLGKETAGPLVSAGTVLMGVWLCNTVEQTVREKEAEKGSGS